MNKMNLLLTISFASLSINHAQAMDAMGFGEYKVICDADASPIRKICKKTLRSDEEVLTLQNQLSSLPAKAREELDKFPTLNVDFKTVEIPNMLIFYLVELENYPDLGG